MDESHRYRADAGTRALADLQPILGLELTATPFVESAKGPVPFKNVIYSYSLAEAIQDELVKKPAVATRENFSAEGLSQAQIDRMKLEDGVRLHEQTRTDLAIYADEVRTQRVKPFMLVIARDTTHASELVTLFKSPSFCDGQYADKVIEVHSEQSGEEREETVKRLLAVESPDEQTEVVIHVNMLKEGWDVTNLYTIVPLRAANARTLVEQSIGRGLRLPYGKHTKREAVDRLTIVAHDNFQAIVDEANRGDSILRKIDVITLPKDGAKPPDRPITSVSTLEAALAGVGSSSGSSGSSSTTASTSGGGSPPAALLSPAVRALFTAIKGKEHIKSAAGLLTPEVQRQLLDEVKAILPPQGELDLGARPLAEVIREATEKMVALTIDVPEVAVVPTGEVSVGFLDFNLDVTGIHLQPVEESILIQHLTGTQGRELLEVARESQAEPVMENYVVRRLRDKNDINYDVDAELLYKLAGQLVAHLRSYLSDDEAVRNVMRYHEERLANLIHAQMVKHRQLRATGFEGKVTKGFRLLESATVSMAAGEEVRPFRTPVDDRRAIRGMVFGGFSKCLHTLQKFDSDPERRFSVVLERDPAVLKWTKPAPSAFRIFYNSGAQYWPDFVAETADARYIVEIKAENNLDDQTVKDKADAAVVWCRYASEHTKTTDGKPWRYLLVPADEVTDNMTVSGLARRFECVAGA
jgi:type III restriction enzyme